MARIRTVKPEFFRHEALQDLEIANPGAYPMMVFAGLWGHCDSKGRFEWKPRLLKLDILPFLPFVMAETLALLEKSGMIVRYTVDGKEYGEIPSFEKHQRITGKEATEGEKYPNNNKEQKVKQRGNNREIPDSQEGKGKEEEKEWKGNTSSLRSEVLEIFDFWISSTGHVRAKLDPNRIKQISGALKLGYTVEDIKSAITGCTLSAYHMGENDSGCRYDSLALILRDAGKIDQFIGYFNSPPVKRSDAVPAKTQHQLNQEATTRAIFGNPSEFAFTEKLISGEVIS